MSQTKAELVSGLSLNTASDDAATIDSSGRLLLGKTASKASDGENTAKAQIESTGNCMLDIAANGTTSSSYAGLNLIRSDGSSVNDHTAVDSGDRIGRINFIGADGSDRFNDCASIRAFAAADFTANNCPAHLTFLTNGGGATSSERMRITSDGKFGIGTTTPSALLEVIESTSSRAYSLSGATELVVERASDVNLSLITTNTHNSRLRFGDTDDEDAGAIDYDHNTNNLNFFTNSAFVGQIDSAGKLIMGSPTVGTSVAFSFVTSGRIQTEATYNLTTSNSANVHISSTGLLRRSTSSARYKKDIIDATWGLADVLKLKPKTFKSNATGEDADDNTYGGFIAEDVHDIGLTNFVEYNDSDQPDAIHYGNMVSLLTKAIQELNTKITTLETKVAALEAA